MGWSTWTDFNSLLTSESADYSLDSSQAQTAASLLNPAARCHSGPALVDGSGWSSEPRPVKHSWSLRDHTLQACSHRTQINKRLNVQKHPRTRYVIRICSLKMDHLQERNDSVLTSEFPVDKEDSWDQHRDASLLNLSIHFYSGPALSDGKGWTLEPRPENNTFHVWCYTLTSCKKKKHVINFYIITICKECFIHKEIWLPYLKVFSLKSGVSRSSQRSLTPGLHNLFSLRSSSLRWEGLRSRAETREAQPISDRLQCLNLYKRKIK